MTDQLQPSTIPARPASVSVLRQPIKAGQVAIGIVAGVLGGATMVHITESVGVLVALAFLVLIRLLFKVLVLVHEAGHALAGRAAGMGLFAIGVGPWRGQRGRDGWRFWRAKRVKGLGGFVVMLPQDGEISPLARSVYLLGGPCTNLIVALACGWAASALDARSVVGAALLLLAVIGALIGAGNLIPFQVGGWSSDGRQLWALWRGLPEAYVAERLLRLGGLSLVGVRPRDWPEFKALDADDKRLPRSMADALRQCVITRAIDADATDDPAAHAAVAALAAGFWQSPDGIRQANALLLATWEMVTRRDLPCAQAWLAESEGGLIDQSCQSSWVRAAIAVGQGQLSEAQAHVAAARAQMGQLADPASQLMLSDLLHDLELKISRAT